jgi:hypothetical protein
MTSAEAIAKLDLLIDKDGSDFFTAAQKLDFLNMAQLEVLNRMVPDSLGGTVNFELDANAQSNLRPLLFTLTTTQNASGGISYSALNTLLHTESLDNSATVFKVISVGTVLTNGLVPASFVKYNDLFSSYNNSFKEPSVNNFVYTFQGFGIQMYPTDTRFTQKVVVLKTPRIMASDNYPDWDDYVMNQVILQAAKLAGVPMRDEAVIVDTRNTAIQSAQ